MSEPTLLQRQREALNTFRQARTLYVEQEAQAQSTLAAEELHAAQKAEEDKVAIEEAIESELLEEDARLEEEKIQSSNHQKAIKDASVRIGVQAEEEAKALEASIRKALTYPEITLIAAKLHRLINEKTPAKEPTNIELSTITSSEALAQGKTAAARARGLAGDVERAVHDLQGWRRAKRLIAVFVTLLIIAVAIAVPTWIGFNNAQAEKRATQATMTAQYPTQVAELNMTATAQTLAAERATAEANITATAEVLAAERAAANATATVQTAVDLSNSLASAGQRIYGPGEGGLQKEIANAQEILPLNVSNFIVETQFRNPQDMNIKAWDYGFVFRSTGDHQYVVYISSDGTWSAALHQRGPSATDLGSGRLQNFDSSNSAWNTIRVIANNEYALFLVNGTYIATIDTSVVRSPGDVGAYAGRLTSNLPSISYRGLTVWRLP